ncbi:MAG: hypothetical protein QXD23_00785 [Candidatus Micrarchaeaceae archaeon]
MKSVLIFSFIFSFLILSLVFSNLTFITNQSYNKTQAQLIINQSNSYIESVNQSGYLFFNPNLTQAYAYINRAEQTLNSSPDVSVSYAYSAQSSASIALDNIRKYGQYAFAGIFIITVFFGVLLYLLMFSHKDKVKMKK